MSAAVDSRGLSGATARNEGRSVFLRARRPPPAVEGEERGAQRRARANEEEESEFIDYTTSMLTDEDLLRGLLFY